MALFDNQQDHPQKTPIKTTTKAPTFISKEMEVTGNFNGQGAVQVEGILNGNITVNSVVIGENGIVNGNIKAKNVIINGKLKGSIKCESLEVMQGGLASDQIEVKNLKVTGEVRGDITVSELLDIESTGQVQGEITTTNLKIDEGGCIIGSMQPYQAPSIEKKVSHEKKRS